MKAIPALMLTALTLERLGYPSELLTKWRSQEW